MKSSLSLLHKYPFEKLTLLKQGIKTLSNKQHIALSIGEPKHQPPSFIADELCRQITGISKYPSTKGLPELRKTMSAWFTQRFNISTDLIDPESQILPVNGTREALFSFVQACVDPDENSTILIPNPFYQIYEGAALLAGCKPYYLNATEESGFLPDFDNIEPKLWLSCKILFICTPGNPAGYTFNENQLKKLIELSQKYDFIIASDECYSEIYADENNKPLSLLQVAASIGHDNFEKCIVFHSLSKRSNVPGLRSGFVAGDKNIIQDFFKYRTYHGCAMPLYAQHASIVAWQDEQHVSNNRDLYRQKFKIFNEILGHKIKIEIPPAGFYIWLKVEGSAEKFSKQLFIEQNMTVLPGNYLSRSVDGIDPGYDRVRIALVSTLDECREAAERILEFLNK